MFDSWESIRAPTSSHTSASSKLPMVTSNSCLLSFLTMVCCHGRVVICCSAWWSWYPLVRRVYAGQLILELCQAYVRWWRGRSLWCQIGWMLYFFFLDMAVNQLVTTLVFFSTGWAVVFLWVAHLYYPVSICKSFRFWILWG